jgi:hypothetical protein
VVNGRLLHVAGLVDRIVHGEGVAASGVTVLAGGKVALAARPFRS